MEENDPSRFRMRLDDDNEERPARKEGDADGRIQVLGKRINRMAVLLPVFVVLVLVLAYLDLEKRVIRSHDTGSNKVQSLSEDLEDRFSSLSVRQAKLEEAHQQLTAQTNTLADAFRKDLETVASLVAQAGEKIGKTQSEVARLSTAIQAVDRRLDPVIKDQKAAADKLGTLDAKFGKEITQFSGSLADLNELLADLTKRVDQDRDRIEKMEAGLARVSGANLSRAELTATLEEEKKVYREMMRLISRNMNERLEIIEEQIRALKRQGLAPAAARPFSEPSGPPPANPGTIIEKSLP